MSDRTYIALYLLIRHSPLIVAVLCGSGALWVVSPSWDPLSLSMLDFGLFVILLVAAVWCWASWSNANSPIWPIHVNAKSTHDPQALAGNVRERNSLTRGELQDVVRRGIDRQAHETPKPDMSFESQADELMRQLRDRKTRRTQRG